MAYLDPGGPEPHNANPSTLTSHPASIAEAFSQLQASWHTLDFVDRGYAILSLIKAGVSRRYLARELDCSEGLIRSYLSGLEASPADLQLARRGEISLRELIRRATGRGTHTQKSNERSTDPVGQNGSAAPATADVTTVLDWLRKDPLRNANACLILNEVLRALEISERNNHLPALSVPFGMKTEEVIECCRPSLNKFDHYIAWCANWLGWWVVCLIPEAVRRREALTQAIKQFPRR